MIIKATTPDNYVKQLTEERRKAVSKLREVILNKIPKGFEETISYNAIGYVVPKSIYPNGYHCKPEEPLPFLSIASQKNFVGLYHLGIYADEKLLNWFKNEYANYCKSKLDMGKSCIRFKKMNDIPFELIGELASKISVDEWIKIYESKIKKV
jgi:uncharacterized protein YdhG (YjbR/CyaY superfamily)